MLSSENQLMVTRQGRLREGTVREFGTDKYILLYLKWIIHKDLFYSTGNSAQCYVTAWVGGELGGEWIQVYIYGWVPLLST